MRSCFKIITKNEDGYALMVTILLLLLMTVIGVAATYTSDIEVQMAGNEKAIVTNFYKAEDALIRTVEDSPSWLTIAFLTTDPTLANTTKNVDLDGDAVDDAVVEIRCVESTGSYIAAISQFANSAPGDSHTGPPPSNSGYSMRYFMIRRYAVTSTDTDGNINVQSGVWKVFNKF